MRMSNPRPCRVLNPVVARLKSQSSFDAPVYTRLTHIKASLKYTHRHGVPKSYHSGGDVFLVD